MATPIFLAIHGACGRMGQRLIALSLEHPELELVAAIDSPTSDKLGHDAGEVAGVGKLGIAIASELAISTQVDVVVDFSVPEATMPLLKLCADRKIPLVIATTGFSAEERREIVSTSHDAAILFSPSMSLVVNLLFELVKQTASALDGKGFDVEIIERHHRFKKDSPSGTAAQFARIIQDEMNQTELRHGREGIVGERPHAEIGIHAIRAGDNVGEHTILFSAIGESLELVHKGTSRDSYARGALAGAIWIAGRPAGMYTMSDVLGLKSERSGG